MFEVIVELQHFPILIQPRLLKHSLFQHNDVDGSRGTRLMGNFHFIAVHTEKLASYD